MPFKQIAKFGKSKKDVLKDVPGIQTRQEVSDIILALIKNRRSVRKYDNRDMEDELVFKILDAARFAPSEGNQQPWEFIIVRDITTKRNLAEACFHKDWMLEAPVFIIVCINMRIAKAVYGERGERLYCIQSVAAAIQNILLASESFGLATCWIGAFSEPRVVAAIEAPEYVRPCAIITLGYPAEKPSTPYRHGLDEIVHIEKFGETHLHKKIVREKKPFP